MTIPPLDRILRPARPRLAAALACVTGLTATAWQQQLDAGCELAFQRDHVLPCHNEVLGVCAPLIISDPTEAWESLAAQDLIPMAWVLGETHRAFVCGGCDGNLDGSSISYPCEVCRNEGRTAVPTTVAGCVAFASDVQGVLTTEAFVQEIVHALRPWGEPVRERILWRVAPAATLRKTAELGSGRGVLGDVMAHQSACVSGGMVVHGTRDHEALSALLALGYMIDRWTHDTVVLGMPALEVT